MLIQGAWQYSVQQRISAMRRAVQQIVTTHAQRRSKQRGGVARRREPEMDISMEAAGTASLGSPRSPRSPLYRAAAMMFAMIRLHN